MIIRRRKKQEKQKEFEENKEMKIGVRSWLKRKKAKVSE